MVEMKDPSVNYPLTSEKPLKMFINAQIVWTSDTTTSNTSGYYNSMTLCKASPKKTKVFSDELNNVPASHRGMVLRFAPGSYYYMCTRNNNFSNRNQKGGLIVRN